MTTIRDQVGPPSGVITSAAARTVLSDGAIRWRLASGRWQRPCRGVIVTHSGPLTVDEVLDAALSWACGAAALAGLTAAQLDGLRGFTDTRIHLVVPARQRLRKARPDLPVVVHRSTGLRPEDIHPVRHPRRTRTTRSVIDAAAWMPTDRGAMAVLAAAVQQRLVRVDDLAGVLAGQQRLRRRKIIREALSDIAGGAQALSELDFTRLVIRAYHLPEPDRQAVRLDEERRRRYLDAVWERWKVAAEIDGAGHTDVLQYWADMERDIDLTLDGYQTLRFPAFTVRTRPGYVAATILSALRRNGYPG